MHSSQKINLYKLNCKVLCSQSQYIFFECLKKNCGKALPPSSHLRRVAGASGAGSIELGAGAWQPTLQNVQSPQTDINKYNKSAKDSTSGFLMRKIANVCWVALGCENNAKRKKLVACKFMLGVRFVDPCSAGHRAQEKGHFVDA